MNQSDDYQNELRKIMRDAEKSGLFSKGVGYRTFCTLVSNEITIEAADKMADRDLLLLPNFGQVCLKFLRYVCQLYAPIGSVETLVAHWNADEGEGSIKPTEFFNSLGKVEKLDFIIDAIHHLGALKEKIMREESY